MWQIVRWFSWLIKGTLLAVAVAALAWWPWSYKHVEYLWLSRYTLQLDRVDFVMFVVECGEGRIGIAEWREAYAGELLKEGQIKARRQAPGWIGELHKLASLTHDDSDSRPTWDVEASWGPFKWWSSNVRILRSVAIDRHTSVSLWFFALVASTWPLGSLALWIHRRRQPVAGHCAGCGYDLRATPEAGGELMGRCPECGSVTPEPRSKAQKPVGLV